MQLHRLIILFKKFLNVLFQILLICLSLPHYSMSITLLKLNFLPSRFSSYQCHLSFNKVYNKLCFKAIIIILMDKKSSYACSPKNLILILQSTGNLQLPYRAISSCLLFKSQELHNQSRNMGDHCSHIFSCLQNFLLVGNKHLVAPLLEILDVVFVGSVQHL